MKNQPSAPLQARSQNIIMRFLLCALALLGAVIAPQQLHAASQTWTNAPVDNLWINTNNWVGRAAPGDINNTTGNSVNADIATFNAPLLGGIGGIGNPIVPDDATVINGRSRRIAGITFDTTNCGPYVIYSPSPAQVTDGASTLTTGELYVSHNGAIRINDSVTNSQAVIVPMLVALPASTPGVFNLVNNSTNPGVTLTINSITHAGATTRATTFILDGTNSAENTVTNLSEGVGNATGGFTKQGPGTWVIAGPGVFPGASPLNILQGTLGVKDATAFGVATTVNVTNGTLRIDGVNLTTANLSLRNGGIIRMNGIGTVNTVVVSPITANTNSTLATTSAADILTVNAVTSGAIDSIVHISGPGTVLLAGSSTYGGKWSVDSGTNQVVGQGVMGTGPNLHISAGGVFDISPIGAGTYTLDEKAFSSAGTGTAVGSTAATISADVNGTMDFGGKPITFTFAPTTFTGDTTHPALFCSRGILSFHGNSITINNVSGTPLGAGTYLLARQAAGNIATSGGFVTLVTGSGLAPGNIAEISAAGGNLNLVVSAYTPKALTWKGTDPLAPSTWDRLTSTNWLAGATPSTFNFYDTVVFNASGSTAPNVNIASVMQPASLVVDTSANDYTFSGPGQVAGGSSLVKISPGTLNLQTVNTYSGGTFVTNGVIKLGIDEGVSSTGPAGVNDFTIVSPAVFDLNNFSNTVNGLNGNGTIDITGAGTSTLNFGLNGDSGTFTGPIQNTSGTLGIVKLGTGIETLTASNSYVGPTVVDLGTLRVTNKYALGAGNSPVTINSGTLDMQTSLIVTNLNGGGFVVNSSTATNILTVQTSSVYNGIISGKIGVFVASGTLRLNAANTYSNGTVLAENSGLAIGGGASNPGPGTVIASNNVTFSQPNTASGSSSFSPPINTVDGATVTFTSASTANTWGNQFIGSASATNIFSGGNMSISGANSFSNFLGTVIMTNGGVRWFNASSGGDNTTFIFLGTGGSFARDNVDIIHLGALFGDGAITGPSVSSPATYWIGGKNNDSRFSGTITGSNNIVKIGTGKLTLDAPNATILSTDDLTYTNFQYGPLGLITHTASTTVSNGVLAVVVPNDLTASASVNIAANGVLDASDMGYVTNFNDINNNPNSARVTNGVYIVSPIQTVGGSGVLKASQVINDGTINPGFNGVAGTLTISNNLVVENAATNYLDLSDNPSGVTAPSDLLKVTGNIGLTGSSFIGIGALNGTIVPGTYTLIRYTGSLTNETGVVPPGPISNITLGGALPATTRASFSLANASGEIDLTVGSLNTTNLIWTGTDATSNTWDVVGLNNFTNTSGNAMQFYQLDNVLFNDSGSNNVVLVGALAPSSVTVNSASNYVFSGNGSIIGDTALTKAGTGSLTLINGANNYNGGTVINGGILRIGADSGNNQNDLGLGVGPVTVNTGGQLRFGGNGGGTVVQHFVTNSIIVNGGSVLAQDGNQHLTNSTVTVNASGATLMTSFSTKNLVLDSPLTGTGNVTISPSGTVAAGQVILNNSNNTVSGNITITTNGNLALTGFAGLSNSPTIDVQQGGILEFSARSNQTLAVVSGQTLKGSGLIRGRFLNVNAGSTLAPGVTGAIGTLTVTNVGTTNFVLTLSGTTSLDINRALAVNSDRIVNANGTNNLGGTLNLNNLGAALVAGDTFQLFTAATNLGAFTTINFPSLNAGLTWNNTLAINGRISVIAATVAPTVSPAITGFSLSGNNVTLTGTNGQSGATYYLLTSTNIAAPTAQWKTVATNVATGDAYSFTGTNAVTPGLPRQFYMLSSTNFNP
jgi:fibronectin-binding autotransporter adhesin